MSFREYYEERERERLGSMATPSAASRGRRRPEAPCENRTDFQRDRDRIIHSKAFRRLSHKTQVFIAPVLDHYRTRMTHTLELAQLARTLARAMRLNEDLAEAVALGHDLGHTPFGHAGEEAMDEVLREYGVEQGFTHAAQSLRVVDRLERDGAGLNLTFEVRDGILRHSKGMLPLDAETAAGPATAEGKLVRILDRVAYINHDLDDAVRAGLFRESDVPGHISTRLGSGSSARLDYLVADIVGFSEAEGVPGVSAEAMAALDAAKDFLWDRVYSLPEALEEQRKAKRMIRELFEHFRAQAQGDDDPVTAATDYIAGMTDRFAIETYKRIFFPRSWVD